MTLGLPFPVLLSQGSYGSGFFRFSLRITCQELGFQHKNFSLYILIRLLYCHHLYLELINLVDLLSELICFYSVQSLITFLVIFSVSYSRRRIPSMSLTFNSASESTLVFFFFLVLVFLRRCVSDGGHGSTDDNT